MRLTKYEKETIILTSEGDDTYSVYTFNAALKRQLADFAKKYPELLLDKGMKKTDLKTEAGISSNVLAKLGKNEYVSIRR